MTNKIVLIIKMSIVTSMVFLLFSCGKSGGPDEVTETYHHIGVINYDSINYNLLYVTNEGDSVNTTIVKDRPETEPSIRWLYFNVIKNANEPYTDEEFLERVKTLEAFRNDLVPQDTVYYGASEDYILDKENWFYSDTLKNGNANHYYVLRFGID